MTDTPLFLVAGTDEAGRGPLAGPVAAAAVILDPRKLIPGIDDSKRLNAPAREETAALIKKRALAWAVCTATVNEIDEINILHASMLAMQRAVQALDVVPDLVLVDGNRCPPIALPAVAVVKGDQRVQSIAAASILAKVWRDEHMRQLHAQHPQFGFEQHKGYPTRAHRQAILEHGVIDEHRRSFAPVRDALLARQGSV